MEKAKIECMNLINLVKKYNIPIIYQDEYNKNMFKFDRHNYMSILRNKMGTSPSLYIKNDKR